MSRAVVTILFQICSGMRQRKGGGVKGGEREGGRGRGNGKMKTK